MNTFTTCQQAVEYLVSIGVKENLARAAINEQYAGHEEGLLYEYDDDKEDHEVVVATTEDIDRTWATYVDMLEETPEGIMFDGELTFDSKGNYLPSQN